MVLAWCLFLVARFVSDLGVWLWVPPAHRDNYHQAHKDRTYYLAHLLASLIPLAAGLESVLRPVPTSIMQRCVGALLMLAGDGLVIAAWRANPYFLPAIVKVPPHAVVRTGVYLALRHPGYIGMAIHAIGLVILFGHLLPAVPATAYLALLLWRAHKENTEVLQ